MKAVRAALIYLARVGRRQFREAAATRPARRAVFTGASRYCAAPDRPRARPRRPRRPRCPASLAEPTRKALALLHLLA